MNRRLIHESELASMFRTISLIAIVFLLTGFSPLAGQDRILIPMDDSQTNHLKAYGIIFHHISEGGHGQWLLNYRGGSFLASAELDIERRSRNRNVRTERLGGEESAALLDEIDRPQTNQSVVNLEEVPEIAVYTPPDALPWDDAVTLALDYAEVPYETLYDREVLEEGLERFDWLHLHHEDFTGQHGKFWSTYRNSAWYIEEVNRQQTLAADLGFEKVSDLKLNVALRIREFVSHGGFLFAMCSGTNTLDISLAAEGIDIVPEELDGDPPDPDIREQLDFSRTFAFENFTVDTDPYAYRHDDIDVEVDLENIGESLDYFTLFEFSAQWDPVPTMLSQNHLNSIPGFYGQTTAFRRSKIKPHVVILGESPGRDQAKYIHGTLGQGTFTFYGGHDPEDYTHRVNDPPTDLDLHPNSPGYRLILNNILFPAAEEQELET